MDEFDRIATYFAPLSDEAHGLGLTDDAAVIPQILHSLQVITKDIMVEGTHFLPDADPTDLAFKLVSVNVSDLAAMGAVPCGYLLGLALPKTTQSQWFAAFSEGVKQAINVYGGVLLGGDTTSHTGAVMLSLTALGSIKKGMGAITRKGACVGDLVVVSGRIGDACIGLKLAEGEIFPALSEAETATCLAGYHRPQARVSLGQALQGVATSMCDISDGLIADLQHILKASQMGAKVQVDQVPLSPALQRLVSQGSVSRETLLSFGDDYELLFTIPNNKHAMLELISEQVNIPLHVIGEIVPLPNFQLYDGNKQVVFNQKGYQHF